MSTPASLIPRLAMPFIGRSKEVAEIVRQLEDTDCQLLTLVGPGGCGKTRLAIEVAGQKSDAYPHGTYFVPLAPLTSSDSVILAIASALRRASDTVNTHRQWLLDFLSERNLLLVLDNFEHLLDSAELISSILAAAPGVKMLITSREPLNLQEEWLRRIEGLDYPAGAPTESSVPVEDYSAITLFVECVHRIHRDFSLADNLTDVMRICRLVQGMPLGIELAAAWLRTLSCARIADEIQTSLDFLESPLRNVPERHRSVRAVFDHSWQLLTPDEQRIFSRLAVFRGGFTLEAAAAVSGTSLRGLSALVDKSLLTMTGTGRYDVHELLRQYGEEKLRAAGEMDTAHDAHARYFADFMAQREADLKGRRLLAAVAEIAADFDNVRSAWSVIVSRRDYDLVDRMVFTLFKYCVDHNPVAGTDLFRFAVDRLTPLPGAEPHRGWGRLITRYQFMITFAPDFQWSTWWDTAVYVRVKEALETATRHHDLIEMGYAYWMLGTIAFAQENAAETTALYGKSLTCYQQTNDPFYLAEIYHWLGRFTKILLGQPNEAVGLFQQARALGQEIGDKNVEAWSLLFLGIVSVEAGRIRESEIYFRSAQSVNTQLASPNAGDVIERHLAFIALLGGKVEEARSQLTATLKLHDLTYTPDYEHLQLYLGVIECLEADYTRCKTYLTLNVAEFQLNDTIHISRAWGLVMAGCAVDDYAFARQYAARLSVLAMPLGNIVALPLQAAVLAHEGATERAVELLGLASTFPDVTGWMYHWVLLTRVRADLEASLGTDDFSAAWERGTLLKLKQAGDFLNAPVTSPRGNLPDALTERELEVLRLIAEGRSNAEIAAHLYLTVGTIKVHARNIYSKLGIRNRTEAVLQAQKLNLL